MERPKEMERLATSQGFNEDDRSLKMIFIAILGPDIFAVLIFFDVVGQT